MRDIAKETQRFANRDASGRKPGPQRFASHEWHRVVRKPIAVPGNENGHDVRVLQPRGDPKLPLESIERETLGELGRQNLDDHVAPQPVVACEIHARHPAATELPLQQVIDAERGLDAFAKVHCVCAQSDRAVTGTNLRDAVPPASRRISRGDNVSP